MITGSITLHNQCHGANDGKFCETPGPGASGGDWPKQEGREFGVVNGGKPGLVDGASYQKAYEITTSDGTKLNAYILAGKDNPQAIRQTLNTMAAQHEMYPCKPPRRALIVDDAVSTAFNGSDGPYVGAWVYPSPGFRHSIFINSDNLYSDRFAKTIAKPELKNWFMPKAQEVNPSHYLITHESGHQYDFMAGRNSAKALYNNPAVKQHISKYGNTRKEEAYAEAFAEWHTSKGKTSNPAARAYAKHEGWFGTDDYEKSTLRASAMIHLQNEEPQDLGKLIPKDKAKIVDTFDPKRGPKVVGDLPDEDISEKEQASADELVEEVYKAMGFDAKGDKLKYSTTGQITLHLIGQHDQSTHGTGGGGSDTLGAGFPDGDWKTGPTNRKEQEEVDKFVEELSITGNVELKKTPSLYQKAIELGIIRG